jgi:hypothetical protein
MDRMYVRTTIENLEREWELHPQKFANNPAHKNCFLNFTQAIERLKLELNKLDLEEAKAGSPGTGSL